MKFVAYLLATLFAGLVLAVSWLSLPTFTPPIVDGSGEIMAGSIAEEEWIEVNGLRQWILTRGHKGQAIDPGAEIGQERRLDPSRPTARQPRSANRSSARDRLVTRA